MKVHLNIHVLLGAANACLAFEVLFLVYSLFLSICPCCCFGAVKSAIRLVSIPSITMIASDLRIILSWFDFLL